MAETNGAPANLETAIAQAVGRIAGRKFGIVVVGMYILSSMQAPTWQVFGLAAGALACQLVLDAIERFWLRTDLKDDNGNGNSETKVEAVTP